MADKQLTCASIAGSNQLEQFVLLAKTATGAALVQLIRECLKANGVYVFGELLDMPNVKELEHGPNISYWNLLNIFAYGIYSDYKANKASLPELEPAHLHKLRHLSLASLATKNKCLSYQLLLEELDIKNVRELEDLIIEAIYSDVVHGKLDQRNQQLEVDYAIGRDIRPNAINDIANVLQDWCTSCEALLKGIKVQIDKANEHKESESNTKAKIETEVALIKKNLQATQHQHSDLSDPMVTDSRDVSSQGDKANKKSSSKMKGLRGSSKPWGKSS